MDKDFECISDSLPEEANLNTTATNEHVTDIECKNCVIKERARALISNFPFKNIPGRTITELTRFVGIWLNQEPLDNGVSGVYYSRNIIMGKDLSYNKHYNFIFGSYVEAHDCPKITNNTEEQTVSGICLGPTAKFQRSYKYVP